MDCPDCDVSMAPAEFRMYDAKNPKVRTGETRSGLLGALGMEESRPVETVVCPDCGLLRFYADLPDQPTDGSGQSR